MIWKIWRKSKRHREKIWKIWKKDKLNSEIIWKIWKISVLVIITPKETSSSSLPLLHPRPPLHLPSHHPPSSPPSSLAASSSSSSSTNWYFKRCISNVAIWKSTGKKYGKMKYSRWPNLYLKKENQNWVLPICKIKHRNEYLSVCRIVIRYGQMEERQVE